MNASACWKLLLFFSIGCLCTESLRAQWPTDFQNVGQSYLEISGKIYDRPGDDLGVPVITNSIDGSTLLTSGDITDLNGGAGAEARFGATGPRCRNWEIRTFVGNWDNDFFFDQPNLTSPLIPPLDTLGVDTMGMTFSPDQIDLNYESEIYSVEFNFRKPWTNGITLIAGPRFIRLNEELMFTTDSIIDIRPLPGEFEFDTENRFETANNLIGAQVGALMNFPISRDLYLNGFIRTGVYGNFMRLDVDADTSLTDPTFQRFERSTSSFVAEVGGKLFVDLLPGCLSGFTGYEATWMDAVALAPVQAQTLEPTGINTRNTPFFHAITFGLQYRR